MTPLEFLKTIWPDRGLYCIAIPFTKKGFDHHVFGTIQEAAEYAASVAKTKNIYFAAHALKQEKIWNTQHHKDKKTGEWAAEWSYRTQKNMRACRVLFFDLDVGPPKEGKAGKYATQLEAVEDLKRFVEVTGLPAPMVVSSGYGVHVYWVLDRELESSTEWLTQAVRLKQLASYYQLKYDPSRTTDSSSVLRVVGTFNHKDGKKTAVSCLKTSTIITVEDWDTTLLAALEAVDVKIDTAVRTAETEGLGSNTKMAYQGAPPTMQSVLKVCPQMQRIAREKGRHGEPEWYYGEIGVAMYTENGPAKVHRLASGHKNYTHAETEAKMDQWKSRMSGPCTCVMLAQKCGPTNEHICKKCPHFGSGSSPVPIAAALEKAPPPKVIELAGLETVERVIPDPPMPYKRSKTGAIEKLMETKEGKQFVSPIYPYDLFPIKRSSGKDTEQHLWRAHLPHGVIRDFPIEASVFVDDRALQARLANNGIYPPRFAELKSYMSAYIQELQRLRPASSQHPHLGWVDEHTKFVLPDKVLNTNGTADPVALTPAAAGSKEFICKKGTRAEQIRLLHFYDDPGYAAHKFVVLASLASPIFYMTDQFGAIVHAAGESGASKSTALFTGASLWGPPTKYVLDGTAAGSTALFRATRREILSNLPLCIDEITHIADDMAKTFTMNTTQTGPRGRLTNTGTPQTGIENERSCLTITTANSSLYSLVQHDNKAGSAASVRIFEIIFEKKNLTEVVDANVFIRAIKQNYGWLGEDFLRVVMANRDKIMRRIISKMTMLAITAKQRPEERFWFSIAAAVLVAGEIAVKMGLITWDIAEIERWFIKVQLPQMRGVVASEVEDASPISTIMNYLETINGDMIKTCYVHGGNIQQPIQAPRGQMLGHYDTEHKIVYVLKDAFRRWCERRGQYSQNILRTLHAKGVVPQIDIKRTLGAGTDHAKGRSICFAVDLNHAAIADVRLPVIQNIPSPVAQSAAALKGRPNLKVVGKP